MLFRTILLLLCFIDGQLLPGQTICGTVQDADGRNPESRMRVSVWKDSNFIATTLQDTNGFFCLNLPNTLVGDTLHITLSNEVMNLQTGPCPWDVAPVYGENSTLIVLKNGKNEVSLTTSLILREFSSPRISFSKNQTQADTTDSVTGLYNLEVKTCILSLLRKGLFCEITGYAMESETNAANLAGERAKWVKTWIAKECNQPERIVMKSRIWKGTADSVGFVIFNFGKTPFTRN
jgi:hypothetical protein